MIRSNPFPFKHSANLSRRSPISPNERLFEISLSQRCAAARRNALCQSCWPFLERRELLALETCFVANSCLRNPALDKDPKSPPPRWRGAVTGRGRSRALSRRRGTDGGCRCCHRRWCPSRSTGSSRARGRWRAGRLPDPPAPCIGAAWPPRGDSAEAAQALSMI